MSETLESRGLDLGPAAAPPRRPSLTRRLSAALRSSRGPGMGIGLRLGLLFLFAALPVFVLQLVHDVEIRRAQIDEAIASSGTLAGLVASRQDRVFEGTRLLLTAAAQLRSVRNRDPGECQRDLQGLHAQTPELTAIAVVDRRGDRWCVSLAGLPNVNIGDRAYFQATLKTGTMQASDFIVGRQTGQGSIALTYPIKDQSGEIISVLFAAYRTSVLSRLLNDPPLPEGARLALLDRDGVIAAAWPEPDAWIGKSLAGQGDVARILRQRSGALRSAAGWWNAGEFALGFAPLREPAGLTVLVGLPLEPALQAAQDHHWHLVGWTVLVFLLAALVAWIGAQFVIVRPLRMLSRRVDDFAAGRFDGGLPPEISGSPELNSLALRFAAMGEALARREKQLVEAVHQKDMLLKEVNHRVKNSLQLVASLLVLQRSQLADKDARRQFDQAAQRINAIAQIHERLYTDSGLDRVSLDQFLKQLCAELEAALGGTERVKIECALAPCDLPTDSLIAVSLMVNELVTNAAKHSFPEGSGIIRVGCRRRDSSIEVSVSDDGKTLPDDFEVRGRSRLGMRMIAALAHQISGRFDIERSSTGKRFVITIPQAGESAA